MLYVIVDGVGDDVVVVVTDDEDDVEAMVAELTVNTFTFI